MASLTDVERERKEYDKIIKDFGKGVNKEKAEFEKLVNQRDQTIGLLKTEIETLKIRYYS